MIRSDRRLQSAPSLLRRSMIRSEAAQRLRERDELIYLLRAFPARVAKLADARDLKSRVSKETYRFNSGPGHHFCWDSTTHGRCRHCHTCGVMIDSTFANCLYEYPSRTPGARK